MLMSVTGGKPGWMAMAVARCLLWRESVSHWSLQWSWSTACSCHEKTHWNTVRFYCKVWNWKLNICPCYFDTVLFLPSVLWYCLFIDRKCISILPQQSTCILPGAPGLCMPVLYACGLCAGGPKNNDISRYKVYIPSRAESADVWLLQLFIIHFL